MEIRKFDNIRETLYTDVLPNGLTIHVVTKPGWSKCFALFATDYGGADRRFNLGGEWIDTPAGVAHFLEHKMFDTAEGDNALSVLSANGAQPNAFTSNSMTAYYFESTQGFYENLRILLSFVSIPYFTPESVQKEQGIIGQEIRMIEDNPGFVVYLNLMKNLYARNPIRDSVAGSIESIAQITDKTLYDCHRIFYNPSNMVLCVAGDVDPERISAMAAEILPREPGEVPQRDYGEEEGPLPVQTRTVVNMEVSAPQFLFGSKVFQADKGAPLLRQKLTGNLALRCLMGRSSPFYTRLYAQGLLNNDFGYELDYSGGYGTIMAGGESSDPEKVVSELSKEVAGIAEKGLDEALFSRIKKAAYGSRLRTLGTFEVLCQNLAEGHFAGYCDLDAFHVLEEITVSEVRDFIAENLAEEKLAMSVVRPLQ